MISSLIRRFFASSSVVVATSDRIRSGYSNGKTDSINGGSTWYRG